MGGKVLEYEAKTILRQGMERGIQQGMERGIQQGMERGMQQGIQVGETKKAKAAAKNLRALGLDDEMIAQALDVEIDLVKKWFAEED